MFDYVHTCGGDMITNGRKKASRKWFIIYHSDYTEALAYRSCDVKKDFKAQLGLTLHYHKLW